MSKPKRAVGYGALWSLLQTIPPPAGTKWGTREPRAKAWNKVPPGSQPALFMQQVIEVASGRKEQGVQTWEWSSLILIYFRENTIPDKDSWTVANEMMDSVDMIIQGIPGEYQTLGGVVADCYIEGTVGLYEGQGDPNQAIIAIPVVILTGI